MHSLRRSAGPSAERTSAASSADRKKTLWKRRLISSLSGLFYRNPAAVTGLMLAPIVVVCTSVQTAAALSLAFLVLCLLFFVLLTRHIREHARY